MDTIFNESLDKWKNVIPSSTLILFILSVVPGVIVVFVRSQFVKGNILPYPAGFLSYLTVSTIYWMVLLVLIFPLGMTILDYTGTHYLLTPVIDFKEIICVVLLPILVGLIAGWVAKREFIYKAFEFLNLNPIHPTPTAWEWCFSDLVGQYLLITLKNGVRFGGELDSDCFVSSDIEKQDIYISEIYEIDAQNNWIPQNRGVYLSSGEVSSIEFIPIKNEEEINAQDTPTTG